MNERVGRPQRRNIDGEPDRALIQTRQARVLRWLLLLATLLLVTGLVTPMITISQLIFISHSFSILSGVIELLSNGQFFLFTVLVGFTVLLPLLKLMTLALLLSNRLTCTGRIRRILHLMHEYGRWAMLDVLVVAVLIVTVKLGAIASVTIHPGLYLFGAAVLLIMYITGRVVNLTSNLV